MAAGEGVMRDGKHIHLYTMEHALGFNTSHTINRLWFGEPYPGMKPNPLDQTSRIIDEGVSVVAVASISSVRCFVAGDGFGWWRKHYQRVPVEVEPCFLLTPKQQETTVSVICLFLHGGGRAAG